MQQTSKNSEPNNSRTKLLNYTVWLLARRNYHSHELANRLRERKNATEAQISEILQKLANLKYIDDEYFLQIFIRDQLARKPQGARMIKQRLFQKKIFDDRIDRVLEAEYGNECDYAEKALLKKVKPGQKKDYQKIYRFLCSRGFKYETIKEVLAKHGFTKLSV
ncbi:hypothetical protein GF340_03000 [Candidatus Peregrinibacteria bacterium]|nr:hypothetical protein [Candidatus Peregrinibacteria bacterium]